MEEKKCEQGRRMGDTRVKVETVMIEKRPPIRDARVKVGKRRCEKRGV
jgi:hypothetical protein